MAAGKRNFRIIRGDAYSHTFRFKDATGAPLPITGRTFISQLRKVKDQTSPDASFVCTITDGAGGILVLYLDQTTTQGLATGDYTWDLQQTIAGVPTTILRGKVSVLLDTSR